MSTCCKAVIFDLDGTILDTLEDLADSMNLTLSRFGFPEKDLSHHRKSIGQGIKKYAQNCIEKNDLSDAFWDEFVKIVAQDYKNNSTTKTRPFDGICALLDFLVAEGISINVLSNKRNEFVNNLTSYYFPGYNFDCVYGEMDGIPKKPDPTSALKIAADCKVNPDEVVFIGDSIFDIITGKNAKMITVGVTWGYQDEHILKKESPDYIASTPFEIITFIKNLNKK